MPALLRRVAQVAVEEEAVEGTAETLIAADANMLVYNPVFTPEISNFKRNPARATLSKLQGLKGVKTGKIAFRIEMRGSGSISTVPSWDDLLRGCGWQRATVGKITVGAITTGPFQPGETVTGGTSLAVGRVVGECADGETTLFLVVVSGVFQNGETLTGGTSSATTTSGSTVTTAQGFSYTPLSSGPISLTVAVYMDGVRHLLYGARGTVKFSSNAGEPTFADVEVQGVYGGTTDTALLASVTYETTVPPTFLGVGLSLAGLSPVFAGCTLDFKGQLTPRTNANSANGVLSFLITDRDPEGTIDAETPMVASHDVYGKLASGAVGRFAFKLNGGAPGNVLWFSSPTVQYQSVGDGDRGGIKIADISFSMHDKGVNAVDGDFQIDVI